MEQHSVCTRKCTDSLDFISAVNRSELSRLCDTDDAHYVPVQLDLLRHHFFGLGKVDLSIISLRQKQFRSSGVKLRSAGFVCLNMGTLVTNHAVERLAKLCQTKGIRRG